MIEVLHHPVADTVWGPSPSAPVAKLCHWKMISQLCCARLQSSTNRINFVIQRSLVRWSALRTIITSSVAALIHDPLSCTQKTSLNTFVKILLLMQTQNCSIYIQYGLLLSH